MYKYCAAKKSIFLALLYELLKLDIKSWKIYRTIYLFTQDLEVAPA